MTLMGHKLLQTYKVKKKLSSFASFSFLGEKNLKKTQVKSCVLTCFADSADVSSFLCLLLGTSSKITVDALELLLVSDFSDMEDKESENSKE